MLSFSFGVYCQTFDDIRNDTVKVENIISNPVSYLENLYLMVGEDFDSLDLEILGSAPIIASLLISSDSEAFPPTYEHIYSKYIEIKAFPWFQDLRNINLAQNQLKERPADINNWGEDHDLFIAMGLDSVKIEDIHAFVTEHSNPAITYDELMFEYRSEKEAEEKAKREEFDQRPKLWGTSNLFNEAEVLKKSIDQSKPIILYFTGFACINAVKFQSNVLSNLDIYALLQDDYIFASLYVDDRTELPTQEQKTITINGRLKELVTIGDFNTAIQLQDYQISSQPYLVIINSKKEVLGTANSKTTPSELKLLLENVISSY